MKQKSNLLTLVAAGLLTLLPTACTDDLRETGGTSGEGYGVPVKGITFFEAESFVEDTVAEHMPTIETNVEEMPDMDVMAYETLDMQALTQSRRAAEANGGMPRNSMDELINGPNLARDLKQSQMARAKARRASGATSAPQDDIVAGRKPAAPVRHKAAANDNIQTRSIDTGEETALFVMGDSVGVYEVTANGTIVKANVKFVYSAGKWNSENILAYNAEHRYFAYHPYRTDAQLTTLGMTVDATATDYETFFSDFAGKWLVSDDQGTYEKYHACDLLAGEATWNSTKATLGFAMHHMMGMLQMEFGTARIYLDWADEREDHYPYWWTDTVTTALKDMVLLPKFGNKYRRITRPGSALTVAAADNGWRLSFEAAKSISRGRYQHYDIGHTTSNGDEQFYQIFYNQLGDILLQDGRLMHRHDWKRITANNPVGIVVGTVYPSHDPYTGTIVGPVEDESYNCHSLERDYLYNMDEVGDRKPHPDDSDITVVEMRARYIRCLIMSLKDVNYISNSTFTIQKEWGAAWSWGEAFAHMPNTHVVGVPANEVWNSPAMANRVNNYWYPHFPSTSGIKTACQDFTRVSVGDGTNQHTPNSGWFIGTCGQYQMAFCFGRERAFGDSWKNAHGLEADEDGARAVWEIHSDGDFYQHQYNPSQKIGSSIPNSGRGGAAQGATTYNESVDDLYLVQKADRGYRNQVRWGRIINTEDIPTMYHDFGRIDQAMQYALHSSTALYDLLSGTYTTSTAYCSVSLMDRFFPQLNPNWDFKKKYYVYQDWNALVTVNVDRNHINERGKCFYLDYKGTSGQGKIRPLMAL